MIDNFLYKVLLSFRDSVVLIVQLNVHHFLGNSLCTQFLLFYACTVSILILLSTIVLALLYPFTNNSFLIKKIDKVRIIV